jgi:hypothetical protein
MPGNYITRLPKADHEAKEWQAAMESLILVATSGGPTMFARIGIMQALNRHVVREFTRLIVVIDDPIPEPAVLHLPSPVIRPKSGRL